MAILSHSTWVRELKSNIESWLHNAICRTPRECVSWNSNYSTKQNKWQGRTPRECVSWNHLDHPSKCQYDVALHVSAWVEMIAGVVGAMPVIVALHVSAWVEISSNFPRFQINAVALHVSAWVEINCIMQPWFNIGSHSTWVRELKCKA